MPTAQGWVHKALTEPRLWRMSCTLLRHNTVKHCSAQHRQTTPCKHMYTWLLLLSLKPLLLLLLPLTRPVLNFLIAYTRLLSCLLVARYTTPYVPSPILPSRS